jgi:hypothetical protein
MRGGSILVLMLAAAGAACRPAASGNESAGTAATRPAGPAATIALASAGGADCAARWNGEAATQAAITERSDRLLEQAIRAIGGIAALTEENMPFVRVEAPTAMAYACVGTTLRALQTAGFASVVLRPAGGAGEDARADFFLDTAPSSGPARANMTIAADGLTWNGTPTDLKGIRANLRLVTRGLEEPAPGQDIQSFDAVPPIVDAAPPAAFVVTVAPDVAFGALHALLRTIGDAGQTATLRSCAGPAGPRGAAIPGC